MKLKKQKSRLFKGARSAALFSALIGVTFYAGIAAAASGSGGSGGGGSGDASGVTLSSITTNVDSSVQLGAQLIADISLVAGIGFVAAALFKFYQHRQNPQQITLGQPLTLLAIGAGLLMMPLVLNASAKAVFGNSQDVNKVGDNNAINGLIDGS